MQPDKKLQLQRRASGAWTEDQLAALPKMLRLQMAIPCDEAEVIEEIMDVIELYSPVEDNIKPFEEFVSGSTPSLRRLPSLVSVISSDLSLYSNEVERKSPVLKVPNAADCVPSDSRVPTRQVNTKTGAAETETASDGQDIMSGRKDYGANAPPTEHQPEKEAQSKLYLRRSKILQWRSSVGKHAPKLEETLQSLTEEDTAEAIEIESVDDYMPRCVSRWSSSTPTSRFPGFRRSLSTRASGIIRDSTDKFRSSVLGSMLKRPSGKRASTQ